MSKQEKRCPRCRETKPRSEWRKNRNKYDGLQSYCTICQNYNAKESKKRTGGPKRWAESLSGSKCQWIARAKYAHPGLAKGTAEYLADKIFNLNTSCVICGLPEGQRQRLKRDGWGWVPGIRNRLEIDHISADRKDNRIENLRVLCGHCNNYRGQNERSDHETLVHAHKYWEILPARHIGWWLKTITYQKGTNVPSNT